jgi:hypothetical protein
LIGADSASGGHLPDFSFQIGLDLLFLLVLILAAELAMVRLKIAREWKR